MKKLNGRHTMSRFVKSFSLPTMRVDLQRVNKESGFVIRLPKNVFWMENNLCFSNELFVRSSYHELREAHYALKRESYTLFIGTPGIGKSHLAALMMAQFLVDGKIVLLEVVSLSATEKHIYYRLQLCGNRTAIVHRTSAWELL